MKLIIIEGPDNIGKSTLIDKLKTSYSNAIVEHFGAPITDNPEKEQRDLAFKYVDDIISRKDDIISINDRSIFGELVYSYYRRYHPDYYPLLISQLRKHKDIEVLFILIYADNKTYEKFSIARKSEKHKYEAHDQSKFISNKFIQEIHKLDYGKVLVFNSNNYSSLDERNKYITNHIKSFVYGTKYKFSTVNSYANIPFSDDDRFYCSDNNFTPFDNEVCESYKICPIAGEHRHYCDYGKNKNRNTNGYGSLDTVKYLFVGEAPGYNGCGKLGIPFYDDISGNIFQQALYDNNISQFNVYVTNIIKCCPKGNKLGKYKTLNHALTLQCVKDFAKEVMPIIEYNKLDKIYAVGAVPHTILSHILKGASVQIHRIYHPAYFARTGVRDMYSSYIRRELKINN